MLGGKLETQDVLADVFGNAIGNSITGRLRSGGSSTLLAGAAAAPDELSEVQTTAQRIPLDANGDRLSNNPVYQPGQMMSPDEISAALATEPLAEVVVSSDPWSFAEELEFRRLMMPVDAMRVDGRFGGGMMDATMDEVAERARRNVAHDIRLDYQSPAQLYAQGQDLRMLRLLSPINQFGLGESILTFASGLGATIYGGWESALTGEADAVRRVQEEWTYRPRTEIGRDVLSVFGEALSPLESGLAYSREGLGDLGYSLTGSPAVAASLYTVPDAALMLFAPEARSAFGSVGGGLFDGSRAVGGYLGESLFGGRAAGTPASQRGSIGFTRQKDAYSVYYEMDLNMSDLGMAREEHFQRAAESLLKAMDENPDFARQLQKDLPNLRQELIEDPYTSPTDTIWHHATLGQTERATVGTVRPGRMQLVPRYQHSWGSPWQPVLHPSNVGGYAEWAIPAGAPRRR
jgi:hypothetical protein